jgi:NAD(P) transhydrogenase subunit alpha
LNILLVKETRAGERRVALTPEDVGILVGKGHAVFVESAAGNEAGFADALYQKQGAKIRALKAETITELQGLFQGIDCIVRAKRPNREREILENAAIPDGIMMIGALDPFEQASPHIEEYQRKHLIIHSLDQLSLAANDPMNLLSAMSKIAGKLAVQDALNHIAYPAKTAALVGFGVIGHAALEEALQQSLLCTVCVTNSAQYQEVEALGCKAVLLDKQASLAETQQKIKEAVAMADIVITSARVTNQRAPLLISAATLDQMKAGAVIVDMALSEGGNVEGSHHDETHVLGNGVIVTNVSGYPKQVPHEASILWSQATRLFLESIWGQAGIHVIC